MRQRMIELMPRTYRPHPGNGGRAIAGMPSGAPLAARAMSRLSTIGRSRPTLATGNPGGDGMMNGFASARPTPIGIGVPGDHPHCLLVRIAITAIVLAYVGFTPLPANEAGGGSKGESVTVTDTGATLGLANGIVSATIDKAGARITSILYNGHQMLDAKGIYWSMDGGTSYQNPVNCVCRVITQTAAMADISCKHTYTAGDRHAVDIDIHYVLRQGNSGLYAYAELTHPAAYPELTIGEWRMVYPIAPDTGNPDHWLLENLYVDDARHWQAPSPYDIRNETVQGIKEISLMNTGTRQGQYECKYEYACEYYKVGTYGWASDIHHMGEWIVLGNYEYFNDGPPKADLGPTANGGGMLVHFGRDHYNGSQTSAGAATTWSKIYGPFLIYYNTKPAGADACWADAKAQVAAEHAAWPYAWLTTASGYPQAAARGTVSGSLTIVDPLKPLQTAAGAWIGVTDAPSGSNWQSWSNGYQYWVQADEHGRFTIPHVRPGTYTLSAYVTGEVGELTRTDVTVTASHTTALGEISWTIPHAGRSIAWEIGIADRTSEEFGDGDHYWLPLNFELLAKKFPNPVEYAIGGAHGLRDFPYVHSALLPPTGPPIAWPWNLHFTLGSVPTSGNAALVIAIASADAARLQISVNGTDAATVVPSVEGGNALLREGAHAKYCVETVAFPVNLLRAGDNTIQLVQTKIKEVKSHIMYDYLRLELP